MAVRYDPFSRGLAALSQQLERLMRELSASGRPSQVGGEWQPAAELFETPNDLTARFELPGIDPQSVQVSVTGQLLTVSGESRPEERGESYYLSERPYGRFSRAIQLPVQVKGDQVKASFRHGLLTVEMPKAEEAKTKSIKIEVQEG